MNTGLNESQGSSYSIGIDISEALRNLEQLSGRIERMGKDIAQSNAESASGIDSLNDKFKSLAATVGIGFGLNELKGFASEVINVRTQMESYETSLEAMLNSKEKADAMLGTFREMAATTPLTLGALAGGAKTMLGFGLASESVVPHLKAIGDISGGNAEKFNSLVLVFSQMSSLGKLVGQDLIQMINAGFNPLEEISRKTGKSIGVLKEEMSKGAITSKMVQDAFISVTQEGGRFNGMLEKQGQGLMGLQAQFQGAWETMLNNIGQGQEGVIQNGYKLAIDLIKNYEKVGQVLAGIVIAVGAYKAALIACNVVESVSLSIKAAHTLALRAQALGLTGVTTKTILARNAMASFNATLLANPYVLIASLVAGLAVAFYTLATADSEAERAQKAFNETIKEQADALEEADGKAQQLVSTIRNSNSTNYQRQKAFEDLIKIYPSLIGKINAETLALMDQAEALKLLNKLKDEKELKDKADKLKSLDKKISDREASANEKHWYDALANQGGSAQAGGYNYTKKGDTQLEVMRRERALLANDYEKTKNAQEWGNKSKDEKIKALEAENNERNNRIKQLETAQNKAGQDKHKEVIQWRIDKLKEEQAIKAQELELLKAKPPKTDEQPPKTKKTKKPKGKSAEELAKEEEQAKRAVIDEEFELEEEYLRRLDDSTDKKLKLLELAHKKTLTQIERERQDRKANKQADKAIIDEQSNLKLSSAEATYDHERAKIEAEDLKQKAEAMREYLKLYGTYEEKRKALNDEANAKIADAKSEGEKLSIQAKLRLDLTDLDKSYGVITSAMGRIFQDLEGKGKKAINAVSQEAKELSEYLKTGKFEDLGNGVDKFGMNRAEFEQNSKNPEKLKAITDQTEKIKAKTLEASGAFAQLGQAFGDALKAGGDTAKVQSALSKMQSAVGSITSALGFLSDSFSSLGESLGSNVLKGVGSALGTVGNVVNKTMEGAKIGATFGPIGAAAGATIGAVTSVASAIAKAHDERHERRIQAIASQIKGLERNYKSLGKSIGESYGVDASKMIEQQNQLLRQKQQLIRLQIMEEKSKKKSDDGKIQQMQSEIESISDTIGDNAQRAKDAIFGSSVQNAISDFANAYAEAWNSGNNRAEASRDFVKKQIKAMIAETIKAASSSPMRAIRDKLSEFFRDGILSVQEGETIQRMAEDLQKELDRKVGDNARWLDGSTNGLSGSSGKGFQTMSQDTGNELNGRFTAIQQDVRSISTIFEEVKAINLTCVGHLADISRNTKELYEINERLGTIEKNTRALR
nr:MAG TPA: tail tape measure protein [Caudoviricetes sp.]